MALSLDAAAEVFREAMRDTVKRYSLWYLIQGALLIATGVLAILYPVLSSAAVIVLLGWLLIISGVVQGLSLIAHATCRISGCSSSPSSSRCSSGVCFCVTRRKG